MMLRPRVSLFSALIALGIAAHMSPSTAVAATATLKQEVDVLGRSLVVFEASAGERNDVVVSFSGDPTRAGVTITDYGAVVTPGIGCVAIDSHSVRCFDPARGARPEFHLGDMDDRLRAVPHAPGSSWEECCISTLVTAHGASGDDFLAAASGGPWMNVRFDGGGGRDRLYGGSGDDWFSDGDRDDTPGALGPDRDLIDGGGDNGGGDMVSYEQRTRPVSVKLNEHRGAERDLVTDIEHVAGGAGDDRLTGDDNSYPGNQLYGGPGRDEINGRGGPDTIYAGPSGAIVTCGRGGDLLRLNDHGDGSDFVEPNCEGVGFPGNTHEAYPRLTRRSFRHRISCNVREPLPSDPDLREWLCGGRVTLREASSRRRLLAHGRIPDSGELEVWVSLQFTSLGRKLASRSTGVRATVRVTPDDFPAQAWAIQLKLPA